MSLDELLEQLRNIHDGLKGERPSYYPLALEYNRELTNSLSDLLPEIIKHLENRE